MNTRSCPGCGAQVAAASANCPLCGAAVPARAQPAARKPRGIPGTRRASALDMEILALTVSAAERVGVLPNHQAATLKAELMAPDLSGTWWTFVGDSHQWFRSQDGAWVRTEAPPEIYIKDALFQRLQRLTLDTLARAGTVPAQPEIPRTADRPQRREGGDPAEPTPRPRFCGKCGQALRPGKKFCVNCGTAVSNE